jgi:hypothetical protein
MFLYYQENYVDSAFKLAVHQRALYTAHKNRSQTDRWNRAHVTAHDTVKPDPFETPRFEISRYFEF